jgi:hypothetical protein
VSELSAEQPRDGKRASHRLGKITKEDQPCYLIRSIVDVLSIGCRQYMHGVDCHGNDGDVINSPCETHYKEHTGVAAASVFGTCYIGGIQNDISIARDRECIACAPGSQSLRPRASPSMNSNVFRAKMAEMINLQRISLYRVVNGNSISMMLRRCGQCHISNLTD